MKSLKYWPLFPCPTPKVKYARQLAQSNSPETARKKYPTKTSPKLPAFFSTTLILTAWRILRRAPYSYSSKYDDYSKQGRRRDRELLPTPQATKLQKSKPKGTEEGGKGRGHWERAISLTLSFSKLWQVLINASARLQNMLGYHHSSFKKLRGGMLGHIYLLPNLISFTVITRSILQRKHGSTWWLYGTVALSTLWAPARAKPELPSAARCATWHGKQANTAGVGHHVNAATPFQLKGEQSKFLPAWKKRARKYMVWQILAVCWQKFKWLSSDISAVLYQLWTKLTGEL